MRPACCLYTIPLPPLRSNYRKVHTMTLFFYITIATFAVYFLYFMCFLRKLRNPGPQLCSIRSVGSLSNLPQLNLRGLALQAIAPTATIMTRTVADSLMGRKEKRYQGCNHRNVSERGHVMGDSTAGPFYSYLACDDCETRVGVMLSGNRPHFTTQVECNPKDVKRRRYSILEPTGHHNE